MENDPEITDTCPFLDEDDREAIEAVLYDYYVRAGEDSATDADASDDDESVQSVDISTNIGTSVDDDDAPFHSARGYHVAEHIEEENIVSHQERIAVADFCERTCGCQHGRNMTPCSSQFTAEEFTQMRGDSEALDHYENHVNKLDIAILAQLRSLISISDNTHRSHQVNSERRRVRASYMLHGMVVCRTTFLFVHKISRKRLNRLKDVYLDDGVVERVHGNTSRPPRQSLSRTTITDVVSFIQNYAEQNAVFLPGRMATQFNASVKLLPTSERKSTIYSTVYCKCCEVKGVDPVSLITFRRLWRKYCPEIIVQKPQSDMCKFCQEKFMSKAKTSTLSETEKIDLVQSMTTHLQRVKDEREFYNTTIADTKEAGKKHIASDTAEPNTATLAAHWSFDMAQLVSLPHQPLQPGPIYFLTGFKVNIFGVMNDTTRRQYNYLIPESVSVPKGSSYILSMFHHALGNFGSGERVLYLHADNCCWQNKNRWMMFYLNWRVLTGVNDRIVISYMPVGHTRFSCDWAFGIFKRKFRYTPAGTLADVAQIFRESTPRSHVNQCILTSDERGKTLFIEFHKWAEYFDKMHWATIPLITSYYHFVFSRDNPGTVTCSHSVSGEKTEFVIGTINDEHILLETEISEGLPPARQDYLFSKIREFCTLETRDVLCPPCVKPTPTTSSASAPSTSAVPTKKRGRPRKCEVLETEEDVDDPPEPECAPLAKKRGRPRKHVN